MLFNELWGKSTPNSWARVPRGPFAAAVGTFLFGSTGIMATTTIAGVSLATMTGFLITTAITTWAMAALTPKPDMGSSRGLLSNGREAAGAFDIVYGEVRKGGVITFMESTDRIGYKVFKNDYLHSVIVLAGHEVEEIGDIYLNDEKVTLDSNGFVTGNRWKELIRIKKHLGSPTQVADPDLVAETSVTSSFRGRGIAYLYVRMDWDKDVFSSGTPTITAMVKGRKVYDPRTGNTAWSDNAALCIRDYLEQPFGVNSIQAPSSLQSSSWNTGANICDTLVTKKDGSTEKRYTINGVLSTDNLPRDNIQKMLTACGGTLFWGLGQWQFKPGYFPLAPYIQFNADDLRSSISLVTKNSRKENFNSVTGLFVDKDQGYTEVEYPKLTSAVFLARDNGQDNVLDVTLPFTVTSSAAQRLAKMAMFRSREEMIINAEFGLKAANVKVGDVIQFTFSRYGFENKFFEVVTWKPVSDNGELKFNLLLKETSAAAYDWNAEEKDIIGNDTKLPNPLEGLSVTNLSVTNNPELQSDGTLLGQVTVAWEEADSAFVENYDVQWKKNSETNWSSTTTNESSVIVTGIAYGQLYNYRVRAVTAAGFTGPWEATSASVDGKTSPPGTPTNFVADNAYRAVNLSWVNPTDKDLNHIEVWKNTSNTITGATLLGRSGGTTFIDGPITPNEPHWYFIRAVDDSGNFSPYTTGRQGTGLFVEDTDIDIDVKELLDSAGLSAVEVLSALPTTDNYVGRTVYLTTDNTIYTWDGDSWESNASEFNGVLEEINFPQDLRPVETVNTLPTTGNFQGRTVFLTTDNKMYRYTGTAWTSAVPSADVTGQLVAEQLAANAVTPEKLATVPGYNLSPDPKMEYPSVWTSGNRFTQASNKWTYTSSVTGFQTLSMVKPISAIPGTMYRYRVKYNCLAGATFTGRMQATFQDAAGSNLTSFGQNGISMSGTDKVLTYEGVAPATAVQVVFRFEISGIGTVDFTAFELSHISNVDTISANAVTAGAILAGSVQTDKLDANAVTADKIFAGAVTAIKIDAGAVTTDKLDALAVTAAKIAANAISADKIQAGAIIASKIAVGDWTNLVPDSSISNAENWTNLGNWVIQSSGSAFTGEYWTYSDLSNTTTGNFISGFWNVEAGREYYASIQARSNGAGETIYLNATLQWRKTDGTFIGFSPLLTAVQGAIPFSVTKYEGSFVAPAEATSCRILWSIPNNSTGRAYVGSPVVRLKNSGELIVDGAIKAGHMSANSVTAGVIAAGAINASALFVDGVITANKINVNNLAAISANLGAITAGSINIGGGKFVVNSNGNTVIRSGTTGARMVLSNNRLDVYDASGTLRVRIGEL